MSDTAPIEAAKTRMFALPEAILIEILDWHFLTKLVIKYHHFFSTVQSYETQFPSDIGNGGLSPKITVLKLRFNFHSDVMWVNMGSYSVPLVHTVPFSDEQY